ncbi:MAG: hypothetical protein ABWW69_00815 [Pyrodictiaceae archaeon]
MGENCILVLFLIIPNPLVWTSVANLERLLERLEILRRLDSVIDLAKGWLQLRILVALGSGASSVDEVVSIVRVNRKAVLDSLRKMRLKGLVESHEDGSLRLSERGVEVYRLIISTINGYRGARERGGDAAVTVYDVSGVLVRYLYLYEAVIALGLAKGHELSLEELSSIIRLSPRQLDSYLRRYAEDEPKLFIRTTSRRSLLDKLLRRSGVKYRLGREGLKLLYKLPEYLRFKRSFPVRVLSILTRTMHPRLVLKRLTLIISCGSALAMLSAVITDWETAILIMGSWLVVLSFLSVLVEYSY